MYTETATDYQTAIIQNDGFWPDIDCGNFEKSRDIPPRISHNAIRQALLSSVVMVNARLEQFQNKCFLRGINRAAELPGAKIKNTVINKYNTDDNDNSENIQNIVLYNASEALYIRAVYAMSKADLMAEAAANGIKDLRPGTDYQELRRELLTEASMCIRALIGLPRASVTLIE